MRNFESTAFVSDKKKKKWKGQQEATKKVTRTAIRKGTLTRYNNEQ